MDISITINDPDLEARLDAYYQEGKVGEEAFDVFCGRLILGQMIGFEMQGTIRAQETAMRSSLQNVQKSLAQSGEETIKTWADGAEKTLRSVV